MIETFMLAMAIGAGSADHQHVPPASAIGLSASGSLAAESPHEFLLAQASSYRPPLENSDQGDDLPAWFTSSKSAPPPPAPSVSPTPVNPLPVRPATVNPSLANAPPANPTPVNPPVRRGATRDSWKPAVSTVVQPVVQQEVEPAPPAAKPPEPMFEVEQVDTPPAARVEKSAPHETVVEEQSAMESTDSCDDLCPAYETWELSRWYAGTESMIAFRTNATKQNIALGAGSTNVVLDTEDLDLPARFGQSVLLGYRWDSLNSTEVSFFWINDATAVRDIAGNFDIVGTTNVDLLGATNVHSRLRSKTWNFELDFIRTLRDRPEERFRVLGFGGLRIMGINEEFGIHATKPGSAGTYDSLVENGMYGGQFGMKGTIRELFRNFNLDAEGKIGFMGNDIFARQSLETTNTAPFERRGGPERFSQLLEFGLEGTYKLREGVQIVTGYHLIYVADIARASDQVNLDFVNTGRRAVIANGDILYHQLDLGLRFYWGARTDPNCAAGGCRPYIVRTGYHP